jgi:hypothetical protein
MATRRREVLLTRGDSSASDYDIDLNDYTNYKNKLEEENRRFSATNGVPTPRQSVVEADDDYFGETDLQTQSNSQYNQSTQDVIWIKVFDEDSQMFYYFNTNSGESSWEKPAEYIEGQEVDDEAGKVNERRQDGERSPPDNLISEHASRVASHSDLSDHYDFSWNEISSQILEQHDWNSSSSPSHPSSAALKHHQNSIKDSRQTASHLQGISQQSDQDRDQDQELSDESHLSLVKQTNLMASAYGSIYHSEHLLVDEQTLTQNKFLKMKKDGNLLRDSMGWEEWLSSQGAVFFIKKGSLQILTFLISVSLSVSLSHQMALADNGIHPRSFRSVRLKVTLSILIT